MVRPGRWNIYKGIYGQWISYNTLGFLDTRKHHNSWEDAMHRVDMEWRFRK